MWVTVKIRCHVFVKVIPQRLCVLLGTVSNTRLMVWHKDEEAYGSTSMVEVDTLCHLRILGVSEGFDFLIIPVVAQLGRRRRGDVGAIVVVVLLT